MIICIVIQDVAVVRAQQLEFTEAERAYLAKKPVLTVASEMDWPPFDYEVDGKPLGYSIDLIHMLADRLGVELQFVSGLTWRELLDAFTAGEIDILPAVYTSDERSKFIAFTPSYYSQPSVIVAKKNNPQISGFASLAGKRVAGVGGFVITDTLHKNYADIEVVEYVTVVDCLKAVSTGAVDAYIDSIGLVSATLQDNFIPNIHVIGDITEAGLSNPPLHIGVQKHNPVLFGLLKKALASVTVQERQLLANKWLSFTSYEKRMIFTEEQSLWIRQHPSITVGLDKAYPPYSFVDENGEYIGIVPEFIQLLGEKTGIKFVIKPGLSWTQLIEGARHKQLDMIAPIVQNSERDEFLNFSPAIINAPLVIMTQKDNHSINTPADLSAMKIALVEGYNSSKRVVQKSPDSTHLWVATPREALHLVSTGAADAFISVIGVAVYEAQQQGFNNLKIAATFDKDYAGQRFAMRSDWPELALLVSKALDSISVEQRNAIYDRWIVIPYANSVDFALIFEVALFFLLLLLALYIHNRRLSGEINRRELVEQELREANQVLSDARRVADQANRSKSRFVSSISHEFKTPLNAVIGLSELLKDKTETNVEERQLAQHIYEAGRHINDLITDLLDLAQLEAGKLDFQCKQVNLNSVLSECLALIRVSAKERGIKLASQLEPNGGVEVFADPIRLKQVVLNLLSNAVKYNVEGGEVTIGCVLDDPDTVTLSISDTGPGLDSEQQALLFQYFERAGAEESKIHGTGIGLALSKNLIEAMGGNIGVVSDEGQGASFWFTLPRQKHANN